MTQIQLYLSPETLPRSNHSLPLTILPPLTILSLLTILSPPGLDSARALLSPPMTARGRQPPSLGSGSVGLGSGGSPARPRGASAGGLAGGLSPLRRTAYPPAAALRTAGGDEPRTAQGTMQGMLQGTRQGTSSPGKRPAEGQLSPSNEQLQDTAR